jgi:hypothetical protein
VRSSRTERHLGADRRRYRDDVDKDEFTRRIAVHLERDLPDLPDPQRVAEVLGRHLFQYVAQTPTHSDGSSSVLDALLSRDAVLFFTAPWDGNSQQYRLTVQDVGRQLGRRVLEIDIDDPVGGAIAATLEVPQVPAVVDPGGTAIPIVGVRGAEELSSLLART